MLNHLVLTLGVKVGVIKEDDDDGDVWLYVR